MRAQAILRVSLTVADLSSAQAFYVGALGFSVREPVRMADPILARLLGAAGLTTVLLQRGRQVLELAAFRPPGEAYPPSRSNDLWFQHLALATHDVAAAMQALAGTRHAAISRRGAQGLPGGIVAFKFRDGEGHPLELIAFPEPDPLTVGGIDHSAISVADTEASIGFYTGTLGFAVTSRQVNTGPAQDALDDLDDTMVDVVALAPARPAPHLELLCYRHPRGRPSDGLRPTDRAASRLVLLVEDLSRHPGAVTLCGGTRAALMHDPDGHALLLLDGLDRVGKARAVPLNMESCGGFRRGVEV